MPPGTRAQLSFGTRHRWGGNDDCNSIGGRYRSEGSRLHFTKILSTLVGCDYRPAKRLRASMTLSAAPAPTA
jgi:heat shock protein HslJ